MPLTFEQSAITLLIFCVSCTNSVLPMLVFRLSRRGKRLVENPALGQPSLLSKAT